MFVQTLETWMDISVMYNEKIKKSHFRQADLNSTNIPARENIQLYSSRCAEQGTVSSCTLADVQSKGQFPAVL